MSKYFLISALAMSSMLLLTDCSKKETDPQLPKLAARSASANAYTFATGDADFDRGGNLGYKDVKDLFAMYTYKGVCPNGHTNDPLPGSEGNDGTQIQPVGQPGECTYWVNSETFLTQCNGMVQLGIQRTDEARAQNNTRDERFYQGYVNGVERGVVDFSSVR